MPDLVGEVCGLSAAAGATAVALAARAVAHRASCKSGAPPQLIGTSWDRMASSVPGVTMRLGRVRVLRTDVARTQPEGHRERRAHAHDGRDRRPGHHHTPDRYSAGTEGPQRLGMRHTQPREDRLPMNSCNSASSGEARATPGNT